MPVLLQALKTLPLPPAQYPTLKPVLPMLRPSPRTLFRLESMLRCILQPMAPSSPTLRSLLLLKGPPLQWPKSDHHKAEQADLPVQIGGQLLEAPKTLLRPLAEQPTLQQLLLPSQPPRSDPHREDETDPLLQTEEQLPQVGSPLLVNLIPQQLPPSPPPWLPPITPSKPDKSILAVLPAIPQSASLLIRLPGLPTPRQWTISLL